MKAALTGKRARLRVVLTAAAITTFALLGTVAADASPAPSPLTAHEKALLKSDIPKEAVLDPSTGAVLSVRTATGGVNPSISNNQICNPGDGCWFSGKIPYANQGFYGTAGTYGGDWPYRSGFTTGSYTASACWTAACSQVFTPFTTLTFAGGALVDGALFTIYS